MAQEKNKAIAPSLVRAPDEDATAKSGADTSLPPPLPPSAAPLSTAPLSTVPDAADAFIAATSIAASSSAPTSGFAATSTSVGPATLGDALPASVPLYSLGNQSSSAGYKLPPPIPNAGTQPAAPSSVPEDSVEPSTSDAPSRRAARRRPAGPVRTRIAANDDAPSIGGLIYALDQKPSTKPFRYAAIASAIWAVICIGFAWAIVRSEFEHGATIASLFEKPTTFLTIAAIVVPVSILWFLALLGWRSEELRLRSSTMTEVAIRLAEPDRMAEQSVASLGQAVRRQVSFMNDAISRALGRAGELEALVHNEVSALERSYEENERKIRGLIKELSGERHALLDTSERVTETLRTLGTDIPSLIDKLSSQQLKLAGIIQGAGENLTALETAVGQNVARLETAVGENVFKLETVVDESSLRLEHTLGNRTDQLQGMLESYTSGLAMALGARTEHLQDAIAGYVQTLDSTLSTRTDSLQAVFEEYSRALDTSLTNRAQALDSQLIERTKALDEAFGARLKSFDDSILRSTLAIDSAVSEKALALTSALDHHAKTFSETIGRQAIDLDESLMQGISSVRRSSENITRQSLKAIEGLAGQSEMLKNVSENLLAQINAVTNRFENQGQSILRAANALESANYKIDSTLQGRHADLNNTLDRLSGKADEFGRFIEGYSSTIEGSLTEAESRARATAEQLRLGAEATKRAAFADLERFRAEAGGEGDRALEELRHRFSSISNVVSEQLSSLTSRFDQTSEDVRQKASRAAADIASEQARLREQMDRLPVATRESAEAMRRALQDQLRAIEQLSVMTTRSVQGRDIAPPLPTPGSGAPQSLTGAYAAESGRALSSLSHTQSEPPQRPDAGVRNPPPQRPFEPARSAFAAQAALPRPGPQDAREGWSLGDLLARASRDEEAAPQHVNPAPAVPLHNQIEVIARALDPSTTAALWGRINSGQRGVMVRSFYSIEGRAAFDDLSARYRTDPELQQTINHYLSDFENIRRDAEKRDPSGRAVNTHLMSDMGRVYLFLAHVSGRIA